MQKTNGVTRRHFLKASVAAIALPTFSSANNLSSDMSVAEEETTPDYSVVSSGSSDSRRSVYHVFEKGDTISVLSRFYGDRRPYQKIAEASYIDKPDEVPEGKPVEFEFDDRFDAYELSPIREARNWQKIQNMDGLTFFRMIGDFGYIQHVRLIPGLVRGRFEGNEVEQMKNLESLAKVISDCSQLHGIDPTVHAGIGLRESGLRARVASPTGPLGPWQLSAAVAGKRLFGREINPYNYTQSAERSAAYLSILFDKYGKLHPDLPLIAYNAGELVVDAALKEKRDVETAIASLGKEQREYPKKVKEKIEKLREFFVVENGKFTRIRDFV